MSTKCRDSIGRCAQIQYATVRIDYRCFTCEILAILQEIVVTVLLDVIWQ